MSLRDVRVAVLDRPHPPGHRGALVADLVPCLRRRGAHVRVVHAERGLHRLDRAPDWDLTVLKSGSVAALHLAGAARAWGVPAVNDVEATRLARDKLAVALLLERSGLPVPPSRAWWHDPETAVAPERPVVVKAVHGSQGRGVWRVPAGAPWPADLPAGPCLVMADAGQTGDDLKVYLAGEWIAGVERTWPAATLAAKRGRPAVVPPEVERSSREVADRLGLRCLGCDWVRGDGWVLVDVNAFPGYKGADGAAALAAEIARGSA